MLQLFKSRQKGGTEIAQACNSCDFVLVMLLLWEWIIRLHGRSGWGICKSLAEEEPKGWKGDILPQLPLVTLSAIWLYHTFFLSSLFDYFCKIDLNHFVHYPSLSPFCWWEGRGRLSLQPNLQNREDLTGSQYLEGCRWERGGNGFYIKFKLKSEIFKDKKSL